MFFPSSALTPVAPVALSLSEPAKSIKFNFPTTRYGFEASISEVVELETGFEVFNIESEITKWDLEECSFILVDPT